MTEWLDQYERVAQRQQQYLQKIRDLRHRLVTKDERYMMLSIERMRKMPPMETDLQSPHYLNHQHHHHHHHHHHHPFHQQRSNDFRSTFPWSSSLLAQRDTFFPRITSPRDSQQFMSDSFSEPALPSSKRKGRNACFIAGERLLPKVHPKHLNPLTQSGPPRHGGKAERERQSKSDMTLDRNKTDYEPIEDIAKRNRIQFSRYLSSRGDGGKEGDRDAATKNKGNAPDELTVSSKPRRSRCGPLNLSGALSVVANAGDDVAQQRDAA